MGGMSDVQQRHGMSCRCCWMDSRTVPEACIMGHQAQRQRTYVTLGAHRQHVRHKLDVGAPALDLDLCVVVHAVRVGQDAAALDDEAAAVGAVLPLALPWQAEVGLRVCAEHLDARLHDAVVAAAGLLLVCGDLELGCAGLLLAGGLGQAASGARTAA